jgi:hypothetical protein
MTFASGRTTLRLTPTSDQSIGRRQGPSPGAATGLQPRRHPGRRPEAPGRPRPRPPDRHRARHLHRAISGLTVRRFRNERRPDSWCPANVARLASRAMPLSVAICGLDGCLGRLCTPATSVDTGTPYLCRDPWSTEGPGGWRPAPRCWPDGRSRAGVNGGAPTAQRGRTTWTPARAVAGSAQRGQDPGSAHRDHLRAGYGWCGDGGGARAPSLILVRGQLARRRDD